MKTIETKLGLVMLDDDDYTRLKKSGAVIKVWDKIYIYKRGGERRTLSSFILGPSKRRYVFRDGNTLNFMKGNLITRGVKIKKASKTSKYIGVYKKITNRYEVVLHNELKEKIGVGMYNDEITAAIAYNKAMDAIYGKGQYVVNNIDISEELYNEVYNAISVNLIKRENRQGMNFKSRGCTSKYTGVMWERSRNKWKATTKYKDVLIFLGRYESEVEAAQAYNEGVLYLYGKNAKTNPVPKPLHSIVKLEKLEQRLIKKGINVEGV